jgi:ubiquitin carboxyl-terminal hydrolase 35/38
MFSILFSDSGIQSVEDSIRGSSDSMGNPQTTDAVAAATSLKESGKAENGTVVPFVSLVERVFAGKVETRYRCAHCNSISLHRETFTELNLAIPESSTSTAAAAVAAPLTMQTLVDNYLMPESLDGDNQYRCNTCDSLQDAVKSTRFLEGPDHLMCTLLRFKYDRVANRKSKVFTDIDYELRIRLPVQKDDDDDDGEQEGEEEDESKEYDDDVEYCLYAVVVHSGYSSDGGHYYTYAREPCKSQEENEKEEEDCWYIMNDSNVSFTTFESFKSVTKRFPRDAAYVLFYRKLEKSVVRAPSSEAAAVAVSVGSPVSKQPMRADLKMVVEKDNLKFLREKEREKSGGGNRLGGGAALSRNRDNNDDDDEKGRGCGGGGFGSLGGRLIF